VTDRRAARGFTLLEVMVSLAILAGALLAVSEVVSGALHNHVRASQLEVATLLARGRMAALEDHYEAKGLPASDDTDEGTFEEEGHPEIRWRVEVTAPSGDLGTDALVRAMTGSDLQDFFPPPDQAPQLAPFQAQLTAAFQGVLAKLGENVKKGLREVRLTVSWRDGAREESFQVTTHMLVLAPGETAPQ